MPNRLFRTLSTLLVIIFLISACTGTSSQDTPKTPLRVSWSLWPGYYPIAIAQEKGFFEKHGVQVEPVFYPVYSNQAADLASGMIDGSLTVMSDTFYDSLSKDVKIVLVLDNSAGADQVVASANIKSLSDLRGKRLGVQPGTVSGVLLIRQMLAANGISPSDVTFVQIGPEKVPASIPNLIDAGYTYEPFTFQSRAKGDKVVFSSADAPGLIVDVLAFRKDIIQNRPEDVKAFIAAWFEAQQYWKDHSDEGNAIIAKAAGLKPEEVSAEGVNLFDLNANLKTFTQGEDYTSVYFAAQQELQFSVGTGDITRPVKINDLLDPSFLK
jgi:NitT/TauT family transport system substrate-binding protein